MGLNEISKLQNNIRNSEEMANFQRISLLRPKLNRFQAVRLRHGVQRHRKPRWIGPAPSKLFELPPTDHTDPEDIEQQLTLSWQHRDRLAAISQFLYEDVLRHSDVGEAAIKEAEKEEIEHLKLLEDNDEVNKTVAKQRELRLQKESIENEQNIREELVQIEAKEKVRRRQVEQLISSESLAIDNRIRKEDLERTIEIALDNPIDNEFAIDTEGHIFRGRETKSSLVAKDERDLIPKPPTQQEIILNLKVKNES